MGWGSLHWTDAKYFHHGATYRAWCSIAKTVIILGYRDPSHRDREQQGTQRSEAFYSSGTHVHTAKPNPHTYVAPYKFNHYKNEVEI
eukprot:159335-Pyramimonas_sp.AAC.1